MIFGVSWKKYISGVLQSDSHDSGCLQMHLTWCLQLATQPLSAIPSGIMLKHCTVKLTQN